MKKSCIIFLVVSVFSFPFFISHAQTITAADKKRLLEKEDSLGAISRYMIMDSVSSGRLLAYKDFVPVFLRALKIKNSFYHPFDSVLGISKLYAPDSSFRIFTWYLAVDDYSGFQKGFIQMRTKDGSLKGFNLFDNSDFSENPLMSIGRDTSWIGAVYYNIIQTEHLGKKYYTLFGLDRYSVQSTKKWIEVLTFNQKNEPVFGGPYFSFEEDSLKKPTQFRYSIEYKKDARTLVDFIEDLGIILVDHLISETDEPDNPRTFVPDGDYEGFQWKNGKWVHIEKVFDFKLQDGEAPVEKPVFDGKPPAEVPKPKGKGN